MLGGKMTSEYIDDLLVRVAHHSTAIEGNTLTLGDTISILIHNYIPKGMTEREYYEVKNYKKAFARMVETRKLQGKTTIDCWTDEEAVYRWWMEDDSIPGQIKISLSE